MAKAKTMRLRAATKREIGVVMDRPVRQVLSTVRTGSGATRRVITDPEAVAAECCEWSARRMGLMQPKWFRRTARGAIRLGTWGSSGHGATTKQREA